MTAPDAEGHQPLWLALVALLGVLAGIFVAIAVGLLATSKHFDLWGSWEMIVAYILGAGAVVSFGAATRGARFPLARGTISHPAPPARNLLAPVALVSDIDPTGIGVEAAAPTVLGPDPVPEYVPHTSDAELRAAVRAALDGEGPWIVIAEGPLRRVSHDRCLRRSVAVLNTWRSS